MSVIRRELPPGSSTVLPRGEPCRVLPELPVIDLPNDASFGELERRMFLRFGFARPPDYLLRFAGKGSFLVLLA